MVLRVLSHTAVGILKQESGAHPISSQGGSSKKSEAWGAGGYGGVRYLQKHRPIDIHFAVAVECWLQLPRDRMGMRGRGHAQQGTLTHKPVPVS